MNNKETYTDEIIDIITHRWLNITSRLEYDYETTKKQIKRFVKNKEYHINIHESSIEEFLNEFYANIYSVSRMFLKDALYYTLWNLIGYNYKNKNYSLDKVIDVDEFGEEITLKEIISDELKDFNELDNLLDKICFTNLLETFQSEVSEKEFEILILRLGLQDSYKSYSQHELANYYGTSISAISRILRKNIQKLIKLSYLYK